MMSGLMAVLWSSLAFGAIANRDAPKLQEYKVGGLPAADGAAATVQCLRRLIEASGRTDIDILRNGDLVIYGQTGLRIEKSNGRHTTLDLSGNCGATDLSGKLFDKNSYNSILLSAYRRLNAKEDLAVVCKQSDKQILKDLVKQAADAPHLMPSPSAR